jgi:hypothetical protein
MHMRAVGLLTEAMKYTRSALVTAMAFAVVIAVSLLVVRLTSGRPSPQQACSQKCSALNKQGRLVYKGPDTPREFYKQAHSVCECQ